MISSKYPILGLTASNFYFLHFMFAIYILNQLWCVPKFETVLFKATYLDPTSHIKDTKIQS